MKTFIEFLEDWMGEPYHKCIHKLSKEEIVQIAKQYEKYLKQNIKS